MTAFIPGGPKRFKHQTRGLQKLIETGGVAALLFDPGLGKTATMLDYLSLLALKAPSGEARVLVVSPLAAVDTWVLQAEIYVSPQVNVWAEALGGSINDRAQALSSRGGQPQRGTPTTGSRGAFIGPRAAHHGSSIAIMTRPRIDEAFGPDSLPTPRLVIGVVNIDTLASRRQVSKSQTQADVVLDAIKRFKPDMVVVDESHKIKSATANASRLLARITPFVKRRALLTGTVMPHGPLDVFGQWRFMNPVAFGTRLADGSIRQATYGGFKGRFAQLGGWMGKEVIGYRNLDEMQQIMSENAIVARKEDSLDLPPTMETVVPVMLSAAEKQAYTDMKASLAHRLQTGDLATVGNRLTQMMRLRQITSGYLMDDTGQMHVLGASKVRTIASIANDNLAGEKRVVIFAYFTDEIDLLVKAVSQSDTEVMEITGATPAEERMVLRKRFGSDDPQRMVMVAQIRTMSLAVNELVSASHAIFGSLSQQRDDLIQGMDRLNRIGQTRPVTFWFALAPGTVDEVILDSHKQMTDLESAMLKHIRQGN